MRKFSVEIHRPMTWSSFWRALVIMAGDAVFVFLSYFMALWARFEFRYDTIDAHFIEGFFSTIGPTVVLTLAVYLLLGLYNSIWSFVGLRELQKLLISNVIIGLVGLAAVLADLINMPRSYYCIGLVLSFLTTTAVHFSVRFLAEVKRDITRELMEENADNIMIVGAGTAGRSLILEFSTSRWLHGRVVCLIDDNPSKYRQLLEGVPVVGTRADIPEMAEKYNISKIIFAIPSASTQTRQDILRICATTSCKVQALPGIYQLVNEEVSISKLKDVDVQDLLGRDPVRVDMGQIDAFISGKVVMVTGGGGSIGSELCRQIAKRGPKQLIIFDIYENNAYDIQQDLKRD